ncbi:MAG: phosphoenolpyruvate--protein phosphotransferase [Desulfovibrionaceae bacterium]|nr:phosphoenolpyruvate--protein phosphotransferase [Desulfovibrionaceae bacterium]
MAESVIKGTPVSSGIAIGKAFFVNRSYQSLLPRQTIGPFQVPAEVARLKAAFAEAQKELVEVRKRMPKELKEYKLILDSHLMMLKDPKLVDLAAKYIRELHVNAEWALEKAVAEVDKTFRDIGDVYIRERIQDVRVVADRVQSRLIGRGAEVREAPGRYIIVAHDLSPADTVELELNKVMAFATVQGGKTSHTGIMARTMGLPALVGVAGLDTLVSDGDLVIVDGIGGKVLVNPDDDELAKYHDLELQFEAYQRRIIRSSQLPAETIDGYRVQVLANIELFEEVAAVIDNGGEGIGLFRSEYSYLNRASLPDEDELAEEYTDLAAIMAPRKVILRTLDLGADKFISTFGRLDEANPAMGLRAIRFCLKHPEMFKTQLRAICRASAFGNVSIMFPMISGLREIRQAKAKLVQAQDELRREGVAFNPEMPVGIMIELPAAVMIAEILAQEVDFFSIGTNDLIQYSLGIDRSNHHVSYLYQPLHPAALRSIKHVVDAAHEAGIEVSLCGEVASDPYCVPILMGMQIDCISLSPKAIPGIKRIIRQTRMEDCRALLKEVVDCRTVNRINRLVKETIFKRYPEELTFFASLLDSDELGG